MSLTKVKTLYAYEDGDTITPRMGVQIAAGHGLTQYYDPATKQVTETDFSSYPPVLFPQAWSSKLASIVVPASGYQWYYNNISDNAGILDSNGNVKPAYSSLFEVTTVTLNNKTFPALRIKGNLVSAQQVDLTDFSVGQGYPFHAAEKSPDAPAAVGPGHPSEIESENMVTPFF